MKLLDGDRSKLIYNIRRILLNISGGNIIEMLSDVLDQKEREELNSRFIIAIQNIAKVIKKNIKNSFKKE